jgi:hypothetical protein
MQDKVQAVSALTQEHDNILKRLIDLEEQIKLKERRILAREEEILAIEKKVLAKVDLLLAHRQKETVPTNTEQNK